jgi:branched-chain amino acid transport system substrate-binding protein
MRGRENWRRASNTLTEKKMKKFGVLLALLGFLSMGWGTTGIAVAQTPGVTATEIKLGQTKPYSGPASAYGIQGKAETAYFQMINDKGGINGRKVNLISLDDAYSPPKAFEQTRRLVEQDEVAAMFGTLGSPTNSAIKKYLNGRKIPQLFIVAGASAFADPEHFPWTIPGIWNYFDEARIYAADILKTTPNAKIAILYANDDAGRDYAAGFKAGLGSQTSQIVSELKYESSDPTVDSQVVALAATGADVFFYQATPKFSAQILRKKHLLGWNAKTYVAVTGSSLTALVPAGLETAQGIISGAYIKDPDDPRWANDPGYNEYAAWMDKYLPGANKSEVLYISGFNNAQVMAKVLEQCGNDLSRENILKQATNLDLEMPMLLPGIRFKTSPDDYRPIKNIRLEVFKGDRWMLVD